MKPDFLAFFLPLCFTGLVVGLFWRAFHEVANPHVRKVVNFPFIVQCLVAFLVLAVLLAQAAHAADTESEYRDMLCGGKGWEMEVRMPNGTRADCMTERLAIEIDFAHKWPEAIGQALNYAAVTGKQPAVILICKRGTERKCLNWSLLLAETAEHWKLPITVWQCGAEVDKIEDCSRRDFGGVNSGDSGENRAP